MAKRTRYDPESLLRVYFSAEIAEERASFEEKTKAARPLGGNLYGLSREAPRPPRREARRAALVEFCAAAILILFASLPFVAPFGPSAAALSLARGLEEGRTKALLGLLGDAFSESSRKYRESLREPPWATAFKRFQ